MRHIRQKLDEAAFFLRAMKQCSDAIMSRTRFGDSVWTPEHFPTARAFQYFFSAFLSAWQCVAYYMARHCKDNANARAWYAGLRSRPLLAAFKHLRDSDIHDETIEHAMRHKITIRPEPSAERGFVIDGNALLKLPRFKNQFDVVDTLTERPILELAEDALRELQRTVEEGHREGHLAA